MNSNYDKTSVKSIYEYSFNLIGKSLSELVEIPNSSLNGKNKGNLGSMVEEYFFKHIPPNDRNPDFVEAGLELKVTGVKESKSHYYAAKERLVLTMIDYEALVNEDWENSHLYNKCRKMLILLNLYSENLTVDKRKFVLKPILFEMTGEDLEVIKNDWETIKQKVVLGKAHELSEGDTFYLSACRKGSGGPKEALRKQPFSSIKAPARAFSFKPSFLNHLINENPLNPNKLNISKSNRFEDAIKKLFVPYMGKTTSEIAEHLSVRGDLKVNKGFNRKLSEAILTSNGSSVPELLKSGILMKTVRLTKSGRCRESMSFPSFDFFDIQHEEWEDSKFCQQLENKFLFIVFKMDENNLERLSHIKLWNMGYEDRLEAKSVWEKTKKQLKVDATNLPKISENRVAHVRPKAKNQKDVALTPHGVWQTKQCFWLNASYISEVVK